MALVATINEIVILFDKGKKKAKTGNKKTVRGRLNEIISSITKKNNLHIRIKPDLICQRIKRKALISINRSGISSPLSCVEP